MHLGSWRCTNMAVGVGYRVEHRLCGGDVYDSAFKKKTLGNLIMNLCGGVFATFAILLALRLHLNRFLLKRVLRNFLMEFIHTSQSKPGYAIFNNGFMLNIYNPTDLEQLKNRNWEL
ncbi:hypothetical protein VNO77_38969 [Canavalia gladiata]|uniref:Uncharacterized protein n=1 Tax=Canavalia gladiata TaxID=3824 RepID=A0AAN9KBT8_CANGL